MRTNRTIRPERDGARLDLEGDDAVTDIAKAQIDVGDAAVGQPA
jgi:hypothetical protein